MKKSIKGIIFDYGGTIDTDSRHWANVIWDEYKRSGIPVDEARFRQAYVHAERAMAREPFVHPEHNFHDVLGIKIGLQMQNLHNDGLITAEQAATYTTDVTDGCYDKVRETLQKTRPVIRFLSSCYPLCLVSNFYGNIHSVLKDFELDSYFSAVIESSVVGVRKPDPGIFRLGVEALNLKAPEVMVVGDSYTKDILPAKSLGCHTVWLKGDGWDKEEYDGTAADITISSLTLLPKYLPEQ